MTAGSSFNLTSSCDSSVISRFTALESIEEAEEKLIIEECSFCVV